MCIYVYIIYTITLFLIHVWGHDVHIGGQLAFFTSRVQICCWSVHVCMTFNAATHLIICMRNLLNHLYILPFAVKWSNEGMTSRLPSGARLPGFEMGLHLRGWGSGVYDPGRGWQTAALWPNLPSSCFCMAHEARMIFLFSNGWKRKSKDKCFLIYENFLRFKIQCP